MFMLTKFRRKLPISCNHRNISVLHALLQKNNWHRLFLYLGNRKYENSKIFCIFQAISICFIKFLTIQLNLIFSVVLSFSWFSMFVLFSFGFEIPSCFPSFHELTLFWDPFYDLSVWYGYFSKMVSCFWPLTLFVK